MCFFSGSVTMVISRVVSISFCGCGILGIYQLGVLKALLTHAPKLVSEISRIGGASAGALVGAILACDSSQLDACKKFNLSLAEEIGRKPLGALTPGFDLMVPIKEFLTQQLPSDAYKKANGRLYISVSSFKSGIPRNKVVSEFKSNDVLIKYLVASCYIPLYAGIRPPVIDNTIYTDGGLINNLVIFDDGDTISVSPFCGGQDICPVDDKGLDWYFRIKNQQFKFNRSNGRRMMDAMFPPPQDKLLMYYETGYSNAVTYLKKHDHYTT